MKRLLLLISLAAGGCFIPSPAVRLVPESPGVVWQEGRAIVGREGPGYRAAVAFERGGGDVTFRVEVQNTGAAPLEIDPARMAFVSCTGAKTCGRPAKAIDPEEILGILDRVDANERARQSNDAAVGAAFILLNATISVAAAAAGEPRVASEAMGQAGDVARESNVQREESLARHERLQALRERWAVQSLRHTTLAPGQAVAGLVYLPKDPSAIQVWLNVRVGERDNWFPFRQERLSSGP